MGKFSTELINMLTDFLVCQIGSRTLDGVTYDLMLKDKEIDKKVYERYLEIRKEADRCGYNDTEVFRVYRLSNGYIFDMDLMTVKQINSQMVAAIKKNDENCDHESMAEILGMPEQQRKKDMVRLARYLKFKYDSGVRELEIAMYNRCSSGKIIINGILHDGREASVTYEAFAIRHWDIETINKKLIGPAGFLVKSITPCEILPNKEGVSFIIKLDNM